MNIRQLEKKLLKWSKELKEDERKILMARLSSLKSVFPFNEYEYRLMFLLDKKVVSFRDYTELRNNYVKANPYLELYGIAPRVFGDIWAKSHLMDIDSKFKKPDKSIDPKYTGEYDLWLKGVKIEVKASRAINTEVRGKLESKAVKYGVKVPLWMNFQQIKIDISDVFILIGVWVDKICYWVLSNNEVKHHPLLSHQHRGGVEYQIGITEKNLRDFDKYLCKPFDLIKTILKKTKLR